MNQFTKLVLVSSLLYIYSYNAFGQVHVKYLDFVLANSVQVDEKELWDNIYHYLYPASISKDEVLWINGDVATHRFGTFTNVKIKLNVLNNSLYTKVGDQCYKLKNDALESFVIKAKNEVRFFRKKFYTEHGYRITAISDFTISQLMRKMADFKEVDHLNMHEIKFKQKSSGVDFELGFIAANRTITMDFNRYMMDDPKVHKYDIIAETTQTTENTWMEVLYADSDISFIKWNYKKFSEGKSLSIVEHRQDHYFRDDFYFLSDSQGIIEQIFFNKNSVQGAARKILGNSKLKAPRLITERKLIRYFKRLKQNNLR